MPFPIDFPTTTIEVIAVGFCCTLLVIMMGSLVCILWMFNCKNSKSYLSENTNVFPYAHRDHHTTMILSVPLRSSLAIRRCDRT